MIWPFISYHPMKALNIFPAILAAAFFASCKPDPIQIDVPQNTTEMTISSATPDAHTIYVSAGYSISSMKRLIDTATLADYKALPDDLLIDDALVTMRADGGAVDTLQRLGKGLYGRKNLNLEPYVSYTLVVEDRKRNKRSTARTMFMPAATADTMRITRHIGKNDTLSRLHLHFSGVGPGDRLLVCYNTTAAVRVQQRLLNRDLSALYDFQPKRMELLRVPESGRGTFTTDLTLQVQPCDTVLVQVSRMDAGLFDYLSAYKRSGNIFSQISGEPVNLPGNIRKGYGYFSMYLTQSAVFDLSRN